MVFWESMAMASASASAHVVVVPFPQAGHTNPMLQFSKILASANVLVTFVSFRFDHDRMLKAGDGLQRLGIHIRFESIPDGLPPHVDIVSDIFHVFGHLQKIEGSGLEQLILRLNATGPPVTCILHDAFLPWVSHLNIPRALFYTQSATVALIYHHFLYAEKWDYSEQSCREEVVIPGLGKLKTADLSSTFFPPHLTWGLLESNLRFVDKFNGASSVILNTFDDIEGEATGFLRAANVPVCTVGPLIPSAFLHGRNSEDTEFGGSPWKEETEVCMKWLDSKPPASVVYVSFGSIASIAADQIRHIIIGLQKSEQNFLWSIRPAPGQTTIWDNFPEGVREEIGDRGLIVKWSPQLRVLSHPSVGAFMSHGGWNSTVEALSQGVPLLACAIWFDQPTNCHFIVDVWRTGVKLTKKKEGDGHVVFEWEEIERCIRVVLCDGEGAELRKNALRFKELARNAAMEGGSSHLDINRFVQQLRISASQINQVGPA